MQIFQKERHPSVYKMGTGNSGSKEGLSLFGNKIKLKYKILAMKVHDVWYHEVGKRSLSLVFVVVVFCLIFYYRYHE